MQRSEEHTKKIIHTWSILRCGYETDEEGWRGEEEDAICFSCTVSLFYFFSVGFHICLRNKPLSCPLILVPFSIGFDTSLNRRPALPRHYIATVNIKTLGLYIYSFTGRCLILRDIVRLWKTGVRWFEVNNGCEINVCPYRHNKLERALETCLHKDNGRNVLELACNKVV